MLRRTRIKFCGITREADAHAAVALGVDALGFVFVPKSPRHVELSAAREIRRRLPPFVSVVALSMDAEPAFIDEMIWQLEPNLLQFHGTETPDFCRSFRVPYIKAVAMAEAQDLATWSTAYAGAAALLLDGHGAGEPGGQGRAFDWRTATGGQHPLMLAGGLKADNVADAIRAVRPYAVDVSSGIESAPGLKDPDKMQAFIEEVRRVDAV